MGAQPDAAAGSEAGSHVVHADQRVARIAERQHGLVTREQLSAVGLGRGAIAHRVERGRLHRVHRGVYRVGHPLPSPYSREAAAVMACAPKAAVSHRDAAVLLGLLRSAHGPVHVTVAGRHAPPRPGIVVHRAKDLDVVRRHRIPVTSPLRTLLDISHRVSPRELERAVDEALVQGLVNPDDLMRSPRIRRLLELQVGPTLTRLEAEERMLGVVRDAKLPPPLVNTTVAGRHVDFYWPPAVAVEVDGFRFHGTTPRKFRNDHEKTAALELAGIRLMRVTWWEIVEEPLALAARLARAIYAAASVPPLAPSHSRP